MKGKSSAEYSVNNGQTFGKSQIKKSPALYIVMIILWAVLAVFLWINFVPKFITVPYVDGADITAVKQVLAIILLVLNAVFITYFWLNGVKDFLYVIWYWLFKNRLHKKYIPIIETDVSAADDRVILVYCTCNDFDGASLKKSMAQNYSNFKTVILDDSSEERYKEEINAFAKKNGVEVIRRADRSGFKAGNINNYLLSEEVKNSYDYAVILDSDEILPPDFIRECLKYFYSQSNVGIVQANHISTRNRNLFMRLFHIGVNSHWPTYQTLKHFYGFSTMLGHGAMIKRECYQAAGGFPPLVAEDLCLSIQARKFGYFVAFAPNVVCEEEYPVDYVAFKKRHSKWTQGNLEFIKKFTGKIFKSDMRWYEKADIVLFTYNLPLTAIFAFFIFLNLLITPLLGVNLGKVYALWMIIPTVIFFFSPMLNDVITWVFKLNPLRFIAYFFSVIVLYGSMLTTSLVSALLGMFGKKAQFIVTPKRSQKVSLWFALKFQWKELAFSTLLLVISLIFSKSVFPVILIIATGYLSVILPLFANKRYAREQIIYDDEIIGKKTLKANALFAYTKN